MYINELIKAKTAQAEILDEANRVHTDAARKTAELEIRQKQIDEQRNSMPQVQMVEESNVGN